MLSRCDGVINLNFISDRLGNESSPTLQELARLMKLGFIQIYLN